MQESTLRGYAPVLLRLALSAVFLWFGITQLQNPALWADFVPEWAVRFSGMSALTLVHVNGYMEVVLGLMLAAGIFVRPVALVLAVHLLVIASDLGISPVGVRDYGLAMATLSVALSGQDLFCLIQRKS